MKKNKILYIGNFSFPDGNASGKRVYGNGKVMKELGYEVIYLGMSNDVNNKTKIIDTYNNYDGFDYYNLSYPKSTKEWINYKFAFNKVIEFLGRKKITVDLDIVIYYGNPRLSLFNYHLIKWCKKNDIKVISDCVDWLSVKTGNIIFDFVKWVDTTYQKAYLNKKVDGVITISTYLENYYKKYGMKTVIIPPLSTNKLSNSELPLRKEKKIKIIYAGLPFRKGKVLKNVDTLKDRIDKTIILLYKVKERNVDFIFNIYGFTKEEYLKVIPTQEKYINILEESICFHGHKSNEEVVEELKKSDFTILIRDIKRDTMAGFPTKVSESISYGIPVITTKTSDISNYLCDDEHGYFISNNVEEAIPMLENILSFPKEKNFKMKKKCQDSNMFFYKEYVDDIKKLLQSI